MNYIKLFEDFEGYYQDVSDGGPNSRSELDKTRQPEAFTKNELSEIELFYQKLLKKVSPKEYKYEVDSSVVRLEDKGYDNQFSFMKSDSLPYLAIHKAEGEWFFVVLIKYRSEKIYKCDQFDGLMEFLDNEILKKF